MLDQIWSYVHLQNPRNLWLLARIRLLATVIVGSALEPRGVRACLAIVDVDNSIIAFSRGAAPAAASTAPASPATGAEP